MEWAYTVPNPADFITDPELLRRVKELRLFPFPESAADIAAEAESLRHLPSQERVDQMFELIQAGDEFLSRHPFIRDLYERYKEESEAAWQRAQREIIERYLRQQGAAATS